MYDEGAAGSWSSRAESLASHARDSVTSSASDAAMPPSLAYSCDSEEGARRSWSTSSSPVHWSSAFRYSAESCSKGASRT